MYDSNSKFSLTFLFGDKTKTSFNKCISLSPLSRENVSCLALTCQILSITLILGLIKNSTHSFFRRWLWHKETEITCIAKNCKPSKRLIRKYIFLLLKRRIVDLFIFRNKLKFFVTSSFYEKSISEQGGSLQDLHKWKIDVMKNIIHSIYSFIGTKENYENHFHPQIYLYINDIHICIRWYIENDYFAMKIAFH